MLPSNLLTPKTARLAENCFLSEVSKYEKLSFSNWQQIRRILWAVFRRPMSVIPDMHPTHSSSTPSSGQCKDAVIFFGWNYCCSREQWRRRSKEKWWRMGEPQSSNADVETVLIHCSLFFRGGALFFMQDENRKLPGRWISVTCRYFSKRNSITAPYVTRGHLLHHHLSSCSTTVVATN